MLVYQSFYSVWLRLISDCLSAVPVSLVRTISTSLGADSHMVLSLSWQRLQNADGARVGCNPCFRITWAGCTGTDAEWGGLGEVLWEAHLSITTPQRLSTVAPTAQSGPAASSHNWVISRPFSSPSPGTLVVWQGRCWLCCREHLWLSSAREAQAAWGCCIHTDKCTLQMQPSALHVYHPRVIGFSIFKTSSMQYQFFVEKVRGSRSKFHLSQLQALSWSLSLVQWARSA